VAEPGSAWAGFPDRSPKEIESDYGGLHLDHSQHKSHKTPDLPTSGSNFGLIIFYAGESRL